tara:strand:+ start:258 stop:434 length:177 start_codon:yes stop_codon:yes gene_type:complete
MECLGMVRAIVVTMAVISAIVSYAAGFHTGVFALILLAMALELVVWVSLRYPRKTSHK